MAQLRHAGVRSEVRKLRDKPAGQITHEMKDKHSLRCTVVHPLSHCFRTCRCSSMGLLALIRVLHKGIRGRLMSAVMMITSHSIEGALSRSESAGENCSSRWKSPTISTNSWRSSKDSMTYNLMKMDTARGNPYWLSKRRWAIKAYR